MNNNLKRKYLNLEQDEEENESESESTKNFNSFLKKKSFNYFNHFSSFIFI